MSVNVYILDQTEPFTIDFSNAVEKQVLKYTNGEPYIKVIMSDTVYLILDGAIKIYIVNQGQSKSGAYRLYGKENISSIIEAIALSVTFQT